MPIPPIRNKKLTRILSIDGGGIRGILPGQVLVALEHKIRIKTGNPEAKVGEYFDFFAGTSTGGILSCALIMPDTEDPTKPRYSAQEAVDLYMQHGGEIFDVPTLHKIMTADGVLDEKYPKEAIESVLKKYFGDTKLSELLHPCLISSYDVKRGKPHFFTQHKAKEMAEGGNHGYDFYVRDVARATSAAPTYFEAAHIKSLSEVVYPLVDGGIFANNPTLCAYSSARQVSFGEEKDLPSAGEMLVFSLGTGGSPKSHEFEAVKDWGMVQWIRPIIEMMMDGVSKTVHYQLYQIFDAVGKPEQYLRIEPILGDATSQMDNAEEENLMHLREAGIETGERYDWQLDKLADQLIENH